MAGKFINTDRKVAIESLIEGFKQTLDNPFYVNLEKAVLCTYFNQNVDKSSIESGAEIAYEYIGKNSPIKYNKINNFHIYGIDKIDIELNCTDWGLENGSDITGTLYILPNTITPKSNDYFIINHINDNILFKVTTCSYDMLDNGNNIWRVEYKLESTDVKTIESQVVEDYEMMINNIGTDFKAIVKSNDYKFIEQIDEVLSRLRKYYISLFYNKRVQTFIFNYNYRYFYDAMMIEFLIRHSILTNKDDYLYIGHQVSLNDNFIMEYDRTFFRFIENYDISFNPLIEIQGKVIEDRLSILYLRKEPYFKAIHVDTQYNPYEPLITIYSLDFVNRIKECLLYGDHYNIKYLNIIIKYLNKMEITSEDIDTINTIEFNKSNITLFYNIPLIIYCLDKYIEKLLKRIS